MLKTRTILVLIGVCFFFLVLALLALYYRDSSLNPTQQEALRRECEEVMFKMTQSEDCDQKMSLYSDHVKKCRQVYDSVEKEPYNFRLDEDGTFFDRIFTNSLCYARNNNIAKAKDVLKKVEYTSEDMITLGAIGCEPKGFIAAFSSSLNFPANSCLNSGVIKDAFLKALNESQFQDLIQYTRQGYPLSLDTAGETHFECPSPITDIQKRLMNLARGKKWTQTGQEDEGVVRKVYYRTAQNDQILILIGVQDSCEYLTDISALVSTQVQ